MHCWSSFYRKRSTTRLRPTYVCICVCVNIVAQYQTYITPGNDVTCVGCRQRFSCTTAAYSTAQSYSPPYWHYYSLMPGAKPCGFDPARLYPGIPLCQSVPRASVSSTQANQTTLTITNVSLSDAGTYTCGDRNPNNIHLSHAVILGVMGE